MFHQERLTKPELGKPSAETVGSTVSRTPAGVDRQIQRKSSGVVRLRLGIRGVVQGVGFRPFVYRLAMDLGLAGWVGNGRWGVVLEIEGPQNAVESFQSRLMVETPPHSRIQAIEPLWLEPRGELEFEIQESETGGGDQGATFVVPDIATCPECLEEIQDPGNRRYRYPFTNCTHCGPRYTILEALPYDRERTSMRHFRMCARCQAEYDDPGDRRFHAQPNACHECGPQVTYRLPSGEAIATRDAALHAAVSALREGRVVAVQGIGGFHLWVAAHDALAVGRLRERKHRRTKPFALMFPSLASVREVCELSALEERLLGSAEAPIVLLRRRNTGPPGGTHAAADRVFMGRNDFQGTDMHWDHEPGRGALTPTLSHLRFAAEGEGGRDGRFMERNDFQGMDTHGDHEPGSEEDRERPSPRPSPGGRGRTPSAGVAQVAQPAVTQAASLRGWDRYDAPPTGSRRYGRLAVGATDPPFMESHGGARCVPPLIQMPAAGVAPENPNLGVMLPYTPLHHLLLGELGFAVVATSGNRGDEPICTDEAEAMIRLRGIADGFLVHDRLIVRPVDDSIVRVVEERPLVLRRARGYAPSAVCLDGFFGGTRSEKRVVGVGGQMKGAVAVSDGSNVYVGQHLGDLETPLALAGFRACVADLGRLLDIQPSVVAADGHPDYASTAWARRSGLPVVTVQHHVAHVLACLAENGTPPPALGVVWDGTGDGLDGTVWGGEFLKVTRSGVERVARLRPFRLPGGEAAVREPRRTALAVMYEAWGVEVFRMPDRLALGGFSARELAVLESMITRGVRSPMTSSAGRLFDAVASLLGLRQRSDFEGDAAMAVEFAADAASTWTTYDFELVPWNGAGGDEARWEVDWTPMVRAMVTDRDRGKRVGEIAAGFHETLASMMVSVARKFGEERVALSGGCFQNRRLTEAVLRRMREGGFRPVWHQQIPPNDGGIALGQVVAALCKGE